MRPPLRQTEGRPGWERPENIYGAVAGRVSLAAASLKLFKAITAAAAALGETATTRTTTGVTGAISEALSSGSGSYRSIGCQTTDSKERKEHEKLPHGVTS